MLNARSGVLPFVLVVHLRVEVSQATSPQSLFATACRSSPNGLLNRAANRWTMTAQPCELDAKATVPRAGQTSSWADRMALTLPMVRLSDW